MFNGKGVDSGGRGRVNHRTDGKLMFCCHLFTRKQLIIVRNAMEPRHSRVGPVIRFLYRDDLREIICPHEMCHYKRTQGQGGQRRCYLKNRSCASDALRQA